MGKKIVITNKIRTLRFFANEMTQLELAEKAGASPAHCIAIEDAPTGILAAKNAGFTCIAYTNPNTYGQVFTHADYVLEHFNACLPIIQKLGGKIL